MEAEGRSRGRERAGKTTGEEWRVRKIKREARERRSYMRMGKYTGVTRGDKVEKTEGVR